MSPRPPSHPRRSRRLWDARQAGAREATSSVPVASSTQGAETREQWCCDTHVACLQSRGAVVLVLVSGLSCGLPAREFGVSAVEVDCVEGHLVAFTEIEGEIDVGKGQDKVWGVRAQVSPEVHSNELARRAMVSNVRQSRSVLAEHSRCRAKGVGPSVMAAG